MEELDLVVRRLHLLKGDVKVIRLCQLALAVGHWRNNQAAEKNKRSELAPLRYAEHQRAYTRNSTCSM